MHHPHDPNSPTNRLGGVGGQLPGSLKALRVLFFVFGGLGVVTSMVALNGLSAPDSHIQLIADEVGMTVDGLRTLMTYGVVEGFVFVVAYLVFGASIKNGGLLLRNIIAGALFYSLLSSVLSLVFFPQFFLLEGQVFGTVIGIAVVVIMLGLTLNENARDHFTVNTHLQQGR